jgi:hypothetical protein
VKKLLSLKERKKNQKRKKGRPVENDISEEIHKRRGFPQSFGKASQKTLGFPTFPHRPCGGDLTNNRFRGGSILLDQGGSVLHCQKDSSGMRWHSAFFDQSLSREPPLFWDGMNMRDVSFFISY